MYIYIYIFGYICAYMRIYVDTYIYIDRKIAMFIYRSPGIPVW